MKKRKSGAKVQDHYEFDGFYENLQNPKKSNPPSKNDGAYMKMAKAKSDDFLSW
jgi:hypothetical protein